MSLIEQLNKLENPFKPYEGPIPLIVPEMREECRTFAGGKTVFSKRFEALRSGDAESIEGWGENYYDLADACIPFEDRVKLQTDSPLLTGIRGIVEKEDGLYVAVDAKNVESAVSDMKYFPVSESETVQHISEKKIVIGEANDVVLLSYDHTSMSLTGDQYGVVEAPEIKRSEMIYGRDLKEDEIIKDDKIIHPAWAVYPSDIIVPLVKEIFEFNAREYEHYTNMGLFLPNELTDKGLVRALCLRRLCYESGLKGGGDLGADINQIVGVVDKDAEGVAPKIKPAYAK